MAGLSQALLITEAAERSGTLHTAQFALEQGREVLAVPGNITSPDSKGANNLIKTGAIPVTSVNDVLYALKLEDATRQKATRLRSNNPGEQALLTRSLLPAHEFSQTLTMLEIGGKVRALGNNAWGLR